MFLNVGTFLGKLVKQDLDIFPDVSIEGGWEKP